MLPRITLSEFPEPPLKKTRSPLRAIPTGRKSLNWTSGTRDTMNQSATPKELRQFGLMVGAVFVVIGLWPLVFRGEPLRWWAVGPAGILILLGFALPLVLRPIHAGWMWIGHVLGWINTRILLGIVFYGLVTPIGIVFRLMGKDAMRLVAQEASSTYRVIRKVRPREHMKYQF